MKDDSARRDKDTIRRMALREPKALEEFYDRHHRTAFTLVLRIVKTREDAEDVLTEVFWQVWQQAGRYDETRGTPLGWLLTIARTRALDCLRAGGRQMHQDALDLDAIPEAALNLAKGAGEDPHVLSGIRLAVGRCLGALNRDQRVALELAYFEGMSHSEIANALKQPLGTMKDRIRTGMMHLRKCLKPFEAAL